MSKTKSKNSNKILEDHDGTFFCTKCGQAGFETKSQGYGHIGHCKGYKAVMEIARKETLELDEAIKNIEPKQFDEPKNSSVDGSPTLNPFQTQMKPLLEKVWEKHFEKTGKTLDTSPPLRPSLGPPSRPPLEAPPRNSEVASLKRQIAIMQTRLEKTDQIAFNHNEHFNKRRNFSGPSDIVNQSFGSIFEIPAVRILASVVAFVVFWNYAREQFDKLDKKRK